MDLTPIYKLPLDRVHRLDVAESSPVFLLFLDEQTPLRMSLSAYRLVCALQAGQSVSEIASRIAAARGESMESPYEQVSQVITELLLHLKSISNKQVPSLPRGFWGRRRLLSSSRVDVTAGKLSFLYHRWHYGVGVMLSAGLLYRHALVAAYRVEEQGGDYILAYGLFLLSLIAHEYGHASASKFFGVSPGEIGATMYFIYPAFYSNVTSCWSLKRWQRVVVDCGGCYFQLLFACIILIIFALSHNAACALALLMIMYSCLFSLNPIFRCDGYWILSDALGVSSLSSEPARFATAAIAYVRRKPVSIPWSNPLIGVLLLYSAVAVAAWIWFAMSLIPQISNQVHVSYSLVQKMWRHEYRSVNLSMIVAFGSSMYTWLLLLTLSVTKGRVAYGRALSSVRPR